MQPGSWSKGMSVSAARTGFASQPGRAVPQLVTDGIGHTEALWATPTRYNFAPVHDQGRVLTDLGELLTDDSQWDYVQVRLSGPRHQTS